MVTLRKGNEIEETIRRVLRAEARQIVQSPRQLLWITILFIKSIACIRGALALQRNWMLSTALAENSE